MNQLSEFEKRSLLLQGIAYKDYLNVKESAIYCNCSESQFNKKIYEHGVRSISVLGKKCFRKADLKILHENEFRKAGNL